MTSLIAYVSDEYDAALPDTAVELHSPNGQAILTRSWPSGAVYAEVPPGFYEICLSKPGYGSKRVREQIGGDIPLHFRLLSDRILGYAWPKWCKGGDRVEFRIHSVEPYKLGLWRYGLERKADHAAIAALASLTRTG
jgi:N,N-dimethylformamidase